MANCNRVLRRRTSVGFVRLVALGLLALVMPSGWAGEPLEIRVLSYNIHHGEGIDGKLDLARIAQVITSVSPDIVALQEVDQNVKRTGGVDQPAELAKLTGMHVVFGGNIELQGGSYGNAILSRWPIDQHFNRLLPNVNNGEQRGIIQAEVQQPGTETTLTIFATHFDHRRDDTERLASAKFINEWVAEHPQRLAILAGDFNASPESRTLLELKRHWSDSSDKPMPTIPVKTPTTQIDFVLYRPQTRWSVYDTRVLAEAVASDHRAIFSVLRLQDDGE